MNKIYNRRKTVTKPYTCKVHGLVEPRVYEHKHTKLGRIYQQRICPVCQIEASRKRRLLNKDSENLRHQEYYRKNKEKERIRIYKWRQDNKEKYNEYVRNWRKANRGKDYATHRRYIARRRKAEVSNFTDDEWQSLLQEYKNSCVYCGKTENITRDHVIPLSKGGHHAKYNIVPACINCNSSKNASLDWVPGRKFITAVVNKEMKES